MRDKEILRKEFEQTFFSETSKGRDKVILELLFDIRDLLMNKKDTNLAKGVKNE